MSLKKPLDQDVSPVANWLLILVLLLPIGTCMAYLEIVHLGWGVALSSAGLIATSAVSALYWERFPILRCLPIVYGVAFGICVEAAHDTLDWRGLLEALAAGLTVGLALMFSIWIETVEVRRN